MNEDVPDEGKIALLVPIPKPEKSSLLVSSYRPISMLPCIGKLMGRMVNNRLDWVVERNLLLHPTQAGFRKHHLTNDQLAAIED